MKEKVIINIEKFSKNYPFSVGFTAKTYGSGSPCSNEEDIKRAVKSCIDWILREGDIPIVQDFRNKQETLF